MTPQAQEVVDRFNNCTFDHRHAIQCAIVAVENTINELTSLHRIGLLKSSDTMPIETIFEYHNFILTELKNELK